MLPELVKNFGAEGALIALALILAGGGVVTYYFWRYTTEIQRQYHALVQQTLQDQRADAKTLAREIKKSYQEGYLTGREHERQAAEERTPPENTRWQKE
jgi:hypothetical protein